MGRIPIKVGTHEFASKAALKDHVRDIVARYRIGQHVVELDFAFLCELIELHPERDQKVGVGIASFQVILDQEWKRNRQFHLHRIDGTATDFSWVSCIDGKNHRRDIREALRHAVLEQVLKFRASAVATGAVCPYRGILLTENNSHVDHIAPDTFETIVDRFLQSERIELEQIEITPSRDNQLFGELMDRNLEARWRSFHRMHARLRLLSSGSNLSEARKRE
jgi:hypothetical protein